MSKIIATAVIENCPFCGGEARLGVNYYEDYSYETDDIIEKTSFYVECTKCGITTPFIHTKESAVEMWNERVNEKREVTE